MSKLMNQFVHVLIVGAAAMALITGGCDATDESEVEPSVAALARFAAQPAPASGDGALAAATARHAAGWPAAQLAAAGATAATPARPAAAPTAPAPAADAEPAPAPPRRDLVVAVPAGLAEPDLAAYLRRHRLTVLHRYQDLVRVQVDDAADLAAVEQRVTAEGVVAVAAAIE